MLAMKDMPYHIGLVIKIYPANEQKRLVAVNDGAKRAVYKLRQSTTFIGYPAWA